MVPDQLTAKFIELVWRLKREERIGDDHICFCPMLDTPKTSPAISDATCLPLPPWTECGLQGRGTTASFLTKARCVNRMQHLWENRAVVTMTKEEIQHPKYSKEECVSSYGLSHCLSSYGFVLGTNSSPPCPDSALRLQPTLQCRSWVCLHP